jgi:hypothetical protein
LEEDMLHLRATLIISHLWFSSLLYGDKKQSLHWPGSFWLLLGNNGPEIPSTQKMQDSQTISAKTIAGKWPGVSADHLKMASRQKKIFHIIAIDAVKKRQLWCLYTNNRKPLLPGATPH